MTRPVAPRPRGATGARRDQTSRSASRRKSTFKGQGEINGDRMRVRLASKHEKQHATRRGNMYISWSHHAPSTSGRQDDESISMVVDHGSGLHRARPHVLNLVGVGHGRSHVLLLPPVLKATPGILPHMVHMVSSWKNHEAPTWSALLLRNRLCLRVTAMDDMIFRSVDVVAFRVEAPGRTAPRAPGRRTTSIAHRTSESSASRRNGSSGSKSKGSSGSSPRSQGSERGSDRRRSVRRPGASSTGR